MQLAGSVAVITGGASGLGAATARLVGGAGAQLALCDSQCCNRQRPDTSLALMALREERCHEQ
jgi:NAD(P)-dependent dehydrogenase (short-subunit alcohol dehydrogenase family)